MGEIKKETKKYFLALGDFSSNTQLVVGFPRLTTTNKQRHVNKIGFHMLIVYGIVHSFVLNLHKGVCSRWVDEEIW